MTYTTDDAGGIYRDDELVAFALIASGSDYRELAERISACLNFCEGFDNIILEGRNISDLVTAITDSWGVKS